MKVGLFFLCNCLRLWYFPSPSLARAHPPPLHRWGCSGLSHVIEGVRKGGGGIGCIFLSRNLQFCVPPSPLARPAFSTSPQMGAFLVLGVTRHRWLPAARPAPPPWAASWIDDPDGALTPPVINPFNGLRLSVAIPSPVESFQPESRSGGNGKCQGSWPSKIVVSISE